jgi:hypothetical protein
VYDSITDVAPAPGSLERNAINYAYSDVLRYMTITAIVASAIPMVMVWFLPNLKLSDKHNLACGLEVNRERGAKRPAKDTWIQKFRRWTRW